MADLKVHTHERTFMARWLEEHAEKYPHDYWFRIPDSESGIKPFDGILMTRARGAIAIEFKVWREEGPFDWSCVRPHQIRELLRWKKAGGMAWVLALHETTGKVLVYDPTRARLKKAIGLEP